MECLRPRALQRKFMLMFKHEYVYLENMKQADLDIGNSIVLHPHTYNKIVTMRMRVSLMNVARVLTIGVFNIHIYICSSLIFS